MSLLQPYLPLLLALLLPIIIHLWNRQKPKRVYFGSIKHLKQIKKRHWYHIELKDIPLLLLRLLWVGLLALLLMQPAWQLITSPPSKKRIYISPDLLPISDYPVIQALQDTLPQAEIEWRLLIDSLPQIPHADTSINLSTQQLNYWDLLAVVNAEWLAHPKHDYYVFATDLARNYIGDPPTINTPIHFYALPLKNPQKWLAAYHWQGAKQIQLTLAEGDDQQTNYQIKKLTLDEEKTSFSFDSKETWHIATINDDQYLLQDEQENVIDTIQKDHFRLNCEQIILVYDQSRLEDKKYVWAALQTIKQFHPSALKIQQMTTSAFHSSNLLKQKGNAVIYLSNQSFPQKQKDKTAALTLILEDAATNSFKGKKVALVQNDLRLLAPPRLLQYQRVQQNDNKASSIWQTATERAILTFEVDSLLQHYQFYSRFHPQFTNLPNDGTLAQWLYQIFFPISKIGFQQNDPQDIRAAFPEQIELPSSIKKLQAADFPEEKIISWQSLHLPLWFFVVFLWMVMEMLGNRRK